MLHFKLLITISGTLISAHFCQIPAHYCATYVRIFRTVHDSKMSPLLFLRYGDKFRNAIFKLKKTYYIITCCFTLPPILLVIILSIILTKYNLAFHFYFVNETEEEFM